MLIKLQYTSQVAVCGIGQLFIQYLIHLHLGDTPTNSIFLMIYQFFIYNGRKAWLKYSKKIEYKLVGKMTRRERKGAQLLMAEQKLVNWIAYETDY